MKPPKVARIVMRYHASIKLFYYKINSILHSKIHCSLSFVWECKLKARNAGRFEMKAAAILNF